MPTMTTFRIVNQANGGLAGTGQFELDDNLMVVGISGTIEGQNIEGLASFDGADNKIYETISYLGNAEVHTYGADQHGISFVAGNNFYNLKATSSSYNEQGGYFQYDDNLLDTKGNALEVEFNGGSYAEVNQCFVTGTRIHTTKGNVAVEDLVVGDVAITAAGERRSVVWIGHRDTDCRRQSNLRPVRVVAHAFGRGLPVRDLCLSPGHPVLVGANEDYAGGCLVPIMCLINGTTIERMTSEQITYWHVELDAHDVLLAEGLPAESYIDLGSRAWFAGAAGSLHEPDFTLPGMHGRCRPVAIDGPMVEAERRRLDAVFASRLIASAAWPGVDDAGLRFF